MSKRDNVLIASACLLGFAAVGVVCAPSGRVAIQGSPTPEAPGARDSRRLLTEFMPADHVEDGSVDYSSAMRDGVFAAAGGTLVLPDYPIRLSRAPGQVWAVLITRALVIEGSSGSALVMEERGVQALRAEGVDGLTLRGFRVEGPAVDGVGLAHGLVQVTGGSEITIEDLVVQGADADGIAVANAKAVRISGCVSRGASKSGLYVSGSEQVIVRDNIVDDFGGHVTEGGDLVGAGIQLSSNADVICQGNEIGPGVGTGILCNAFQGGSAPRGTLIQANRIRGARNPDNLQSSSGIRLSNGAAEGATRTVVAANQIEDCGAYGILLENHDDATIDGNWITGTERSGIVVGTVRGALVLRNVLRDVGTTPMEGMDSIVLINDASGVVVRDNELGHLSEGNLASAHARARDFSRARQNTIHPRVLAAPARPTAGLWYRGDLLLNSAADPAAPLGWFCVGTGVPGDWREVQLR